MADQPAGFCQFMKLRKNLKDDYNENNNKNCNVNFIKKLFSPVRPACPTKPWRSRELVEGNRTEKKQTKPFPNSHY